MAPKVERTPEPVAVSGWWVVGRTKGPLPDLHRLAVKQDPQADKRGTYATRCDVLVRRIMEVPVGTVAHLCKDCR
jgi:hypothetical protein